MALSNGVSTIKVGKELTEHTKGCLYVIKEFIPPLKVTI
jgi:hypothetical protein